MFEKIKKMVTKENITFVVFIGTMAFIVYKYNSVMDELVDTTK